MRRFPLGEALMFLPIIPVVRRALEPERESLALWRTRWGLFAGLMTATYQVLFFGGVHLATYIDGAFEGAAAAAMPSGSPSRSASSRR